MSFEQDVLSKVTTIYLQITNSNTNIFGNYIKYICVGVCNLQLYRSNFAKISKHFVDYIIHYLTLMVMMYSAF